MGLSLLVAAGLLIALPAMADTVTGTITTGSGVQTGIGGTVISAPTASPAAGTYTSAQTVSLSAGGSSSIVYTTDDTTVPNCSGTGTTYSSAISVTSSATIEAISCYPNSQSSTVVSDSYTINIPAPSGGGGGGGGGSSAPVGAVISSFTASPSTIVLGQSAILSWSVANSSSLSIDQGVGTLPGTAVGSVTVSPQTSTVYTLTATGGGISAAAKATVTVTTSAGAVIGTVPATNNQPGLSLSGAHAPGSVILTSDGTVWFITLDNTRRAFTSGGAFLSYGFLSFSQVANANAADLNLPQGAFIPPMDGKIVCSDRDDSYAKKGTCYLITGGKRAAFTSAKVFTALGFKFKHTTIGDVSFLATDADISDATLAHRPGVLVNNNGTVELVGQNSLMGIPSMDVLASWGYTLADVVPANAADKAIAQSGVMSARVTGQLSP